MSWAGVIGGLIARLSSRPPEGSRFHPAGFLMSIVGAIISAKIIARGFEGRMAFVPEGQADSSQARTAWVAMERGSVPEATVEVIVSSTDIWSRN